VDFKLDNSWDHWGHQSPYGNGRNPVAYFLQNPSSCIAHLHLLVVLSTKLPYLKELAFQQDPRHESVRRHSKLQVVLVV
jgi:hypothetical protein